LILVLLIFTGSQFIIFYKNKPLYHEGTLIYVSILYAINLWINIVLFLTKSLEVYKFKGSAYLIAVVPIIIVCYIVYNTEEKDVWLKRTIIEMKTGEELDCKLRCMTGILFVEKEEVAIRRNEILLRGYLRKHESTCNILDCPLKTVKKLMENPENQNIYKNENIMQNIYSYIGKRYSAGLTK
jgi:hypothetical protein